LCRSCCFGVGCLRTSLEWSFYCACCSQRVAVILPSYYKDKVCLWAYSGKKRKSRHVLAVGANEHARSVAKQKLFKTNGRGKNANTGRSMENKTSGNRNQYVIRRSCTTRRSVTYQAASSTRKRRPTMMLLLGLIPGFLPVHEEEWVRGTSDILQEGTAARAGVTASASDGSTTRHGFLPTPKPPPRTFRSAPPNLPPTSRRHHGLEAIPTVSPWSP
jgi:hypothetical protein